MKNIKYFYELGNRTYSRNSPKKEEKKKKRAEVKLFIRDPVFLLRKSWSPKLKTPLFQKQDEVDGNKRCF